MKQERQNYHWFESFNDRKKFWKHKHQLRLRHLGEVLVFLRTNFTTTPPLLGIDLVIICIN